MVGNELLVDPDRIGILGGATADHHSMNIFNHPDAYKVALQACLYPT